jgi:hypothetical protein
VTEQDQIKQTIRNALEFDFDSFRAGVLASSGPIEQCTSGHDMYGDSCISAEER